MTDKRKLGDFGEKKVKNYLRLKGYKVIGSNYTAKYGEIDIIAKKSDLIIFVEVKTRKAGSMVKGVYAVNLAKRQRIIKTAKKFMYENNIGLQPRFDVAEVEVTDGFIKRAKINYIENAY